MNFELHLFLPPPPPPPPHPCLLSLHYFPEIARASLHIAIPWYKHIYGIPFFSVSSTRICLLRQIWPMPRQRRMDLPCQWAGHAELFCNKMECVWITMKKVRIRFALIWLILYFPFQAHCVQEADCIRIVPHPHRGQGDIVKLDKKNPSDVLVHLQLPTRHIFYIFALTVHVYPPCLPLLQQTTTSHLPVPT